MPFLVFRFAIYFAITLGMKSKAQGWPAGQRGGWRQGVKGHSALSLFATLLEQPVHRSIQPNPIGQVYCRRDIQGDKYFFGGGPRPQGSCRSLKGHRGNQ